MKNFFERFYFFLKAIKDHLEGWIALLSLKQKMALTAFAITLVSLYVSSHWIRGIEKKEPAVYVEVATPRLLEMKAVVSASGTVKAKQETTLSSKIAGRANKIITSEGNTVAQDEPLIELDATELEIQKDIAESAQRRAASSVDEGNYKRHKILYEEGVISKAEFDKIELEYKGSKAEKERLENTVKLQDEHVQSSRIQAPFHAIVAKIFIHEGEVVAPGQPLVQLVNMDEVLIEIPIIAKHIPKILPGLETQVSVEGLPQTFQGSVFRVSPVADPMSRTFETQIMVQNQTHILKPGMFAKVEVITDRKPQALTLPKAALVKQEERAGQFIYIIENQTAHLKEIQTGLESDHHIEILTPLAPNTQVVTAGQSQLHDTAHVSIVASPHEVH
ncbi:MAG: efflux RND transporter periplasmic adaptor subunit [Deltaproteobacteria bacterium]|nr:efflux RND transporter periplasmic adaptor subunit [Deltaproteobacteria bacterium]